jgi:hypothetical protein
MENNIIDQAGCLENTPLLTQRVKSGSVSGFALLDLRSRSRARSAFKRFSKTPRLIHFVYELKEEEI